MIGLSIFFINFLLGAFVRFVLTPILLYHVAFILGGSMRFIMGFVVGSPTSLSYLSDFSSLGTALYTSTLLFENLSYVIDCAVGYQKGKEFHEGITRNEFLKLLIMLIHLKEATRCLAIKRSLKTYIPWILFQWFSVFSEQSLKYC